MTNNETALRGALKELVGCLFLVGKAYQVKSKNLTTGEAKRALEELLDSLMGKTLASDVRHDMLRSRKYGNALIRAQEVLENE